MPFSCYALTAWLHTPYTSPGHAAGCVARSGHAHTARSYHACHAHAGLASSIIRSVHKGHAGEERQSGLGTPTLYRSSFASAGGHTAPCSPTPSQLGSTRGGRRLPTRSSTGVDVSRVRRLRGSGTGHVEQPGDASGTPSDCKLDGIARSRTPSLEGAAFAEESGEEVSLMESGMRHATSSPGADHLDTEERVIASHRSSRGCEAAGPKGCPPHATAATACDANCAQPGTSTISKERSMLTPEARDGDGVWRAKAITRAEAAQVTAGSSGFYDMKPSHRRVSSHMGSSPTRDGLVDTDCRRLGHKPNGNGSLSRQEHRGSSATDATATVATGQQECAPGMLALDDQDPAVSTLGPLPVRPVAALKLGGAQVWMVCVCSVLRTVGLIRCILCFTQCVQKLHGLVCAVLGCLCILLSLNSQIVTHLSLTSFVHLPFCLLPAGECVPSTVPSDHQHTQQQLRNGACSRASQQLGPAGERPAAAFISTLHPPFPRASAHWKLLCACCLRAWGISAWGTAHILCLGHWLHSLNACTDCGAVHIANPEF